MVKKFLLPPAKKDNVVKSGTMTLHINNTNSISEVREKFHQCFPDLKLEFFFMGNEQLRLSDPLSRSFQFIPLREMCKTKPDASADIEEKMTLKEVENLFQKEFGLTAKVYVKDGNYWIRSAGYDSRPLLN